MTKTLQLVGILFLLAITTVVARAEEAIQTYEISGEISARLNDLKKTYIPQHVLERTRTRIQSKSGKIDAQIESRYHYMRNGVWTSESSFTMGTRVLSTNQSISICGMFDALAINGTNIKTDTALVLPAGKAFAPFAIKSSVNVANKMKMTDLITELEKVCEPRAGQHFSFELASETEISSSAVLSSSRVIKASLQGTCEVLSPVDASTLHPKLVGQYLPVVCNAKTQDNRDVTRSYAFLVESGIHLLLNSRTELDENTYTIIDVEYAK